MENTLYTLRLISCVVLFHDTKLKTLMICGAKFKTEKDYEVFRLIDKVRLELWIISSKITNEM